MEIQPASIAQVMNAGDRWVEISADVGMVTDDLKRIDKSLGVRLNVHCPEPFWAVFCRPDDHSTYLVLTVKAHQNHAGTWEGLDQRVVREIERIAADDYDYATAVEDRQHASVKLREDRRSEMLRQAGEEGYRVLRGLIGRNCSHMRVPRAVSS